MWILIPAYEPDTRLIDLVAQLVPHLPVLVVDDGSGQAFDDVFDAVSGAGGVVIRQGTNQGKGEALRIGFRWILSHAPGHSVVCADSDGQHREGDILRVAHELFERASQGEPDAVVLGARAFVGNVPLRSRVGNRVTTALVAASTGTRIRDTQTGLRGYPTSLIPWALSVSGGRFAYELRLLLQASRHGVPTVEIEIQTVYLDDNSSSHFRPVLDSVLVLVPLLLFSLSSIAAFVVNTSALLVLNAATGSLALSLLGARLLSATVNFTLNRRAVFHDNGRIWPQLARYIPLALALLGASYLGLLTLTHLGMAIIPAKILADFVLWLTSYGVQRSLIFKPNRTQHANLNGPSSLHEFPVARR